MPSNPSDELREKIDDILGLELNEGLLVYIPDGEAMATIDLSSIVDELLALIQQQTAAAYKAGYIKGGIEEILRHENARKTVEAELQKEGKE